MSTQFSSDSMDFLEVHSEYNRREIARVYHHCVNMHTNVHDSVEIVYVHRGVLRLYIDGALFVLQKGEAIIINSGCVHVGFVDSPEETVYDAMLLDLRSLCLQPPCEPDLDIFQRLIGRKLRLACRVFREEDAGELLGEIRRALAIVAQKAVAWKLQTVSLCYSIVAFCVANGFLEAAPQREAEAHKTPFETDVDLCVAFTSYVDLHYCEARKMSEIAAALFISESKLYKVCKAILKCSPHEYISRFRLMTAARFLQFSDMSVTEVCFACGFRSVNHFISKFCQEYGCTPQAFRKNTKK